MKLKGKNVLVLGLAKSGLSAIDFLYEKGSFVFGYDDNPLVMSELSNKDISCTFVNKITEQVLQIMDLIVISPGVSVYTEYAKLAMLLGVKIISELQLGCYFLKGSLIGVTGSNGKTTTTNLIHDILSGANVTNQMVGNVGEPITSHIMPFKTNYVAEISSFQLEASPDIKPKVACILNVTSNHLDRHFSFKNYFETKCQIYKNMDSDGFLILNADDKNLAKFKQTDFKPKLIWFSTKKIIDGFCIIDEHLCLKLGNRIEKIVCVKDVKLLGEHNLSNILCAIAVAVTFKVKPKQIARVVSNFYAMPHRLQFVKNIGGVSYFNDSKSTTPEATITAIKSFKFEPIILIMGGSDKGLSFDPLSKRLNKRVKLIVVMGNTTKKIIDNFNKFEFKNFIVANSFSDALKIATKHSVAGDVVLLSPACASFDFFKNFEQRGDKFIEYVESLEREKN
jgi:UDP-N-acetylmuramoylalanine--D-glutamate ligase